MTLVPCGRQAGGQLGGFLEEVSRMRSGGPWGPLAPTFLAHSPLPAKALLGEEPLASVPLSFLTVVTRPSEL